MVKSVCLMVNDASVACESTRLCRFYTFCMQSLGCTLYSMAYLETPFEHLAAQGLWVVACLAFSSSSSSPLLLILFCLFSIPCAHVCMHTM